jgi:hypothetical protein
VSAARRRCTPRARPLNPGRFERFQVVAEEAAAGLEQLSNTLAITAVETKKAGAQVIRDGSKHVGRFLLLTSIAAAQGPQRF